MHFISSLRSRVLFNLILALLPAAIIISLNIWYEYRTEKQLIQNEVRATVDALASEHIEAIVEIQKVLKELSQFSELQAPSSQACNSIISKALKLHKELSNLGVPLANGDLLCNATPLTKKVNVADRLYFQEAINEQRLSMSEFQTDRATQQTSLNFAYPVLDQNNNSIAAVVAVTDFERWREEVSKLTLPDDSVVIVYDEHRYISFFQSLALPQQNITSLKDVFIEGDVFNDSITEVVGKDGIRRLALSINLLPQRFNHNMTMVVALPIEHVYEGVIYTFLRNVVLFIICSFLFFFVLFFGLNKSVLSPVRQLLSSTRKYVESKNGQSSEKTNELTLLSQHFEFVLQEQEMIEGELIDKEKRLSGAYKRINNLLDNSTYGVVEWDPNLNISRWSKMCHSIFSIDAETLIGTNITETKGIVGDYFSNMSLELEKMSAGHSEQAHCESSFRNQSGEVVVLKWKLSAIYDHDNLIGILGLVENITKQVEYQQEIEHQARFDTLTGAPNRYAFIRNLDIKIEHKSHFSLLHIDIKGFKFVNDHYGHKLGDHLLKTLVKHIEKQVREGEFFARLSGNEFIYLLPFNDDLQINSRLDTLRSIFCEPIKLGDVNHVSYIHCGISKTSEFIYSAEEVLRQAGIALHYAKRHSKSDTYIYSTEMEEQERLRFDLEHELKAALINEEFELYYQPILNHRTSSFDAAEALIRWNHPEKGLIPPDKFIPLAEETGFIHQLGHWVLEESIRQISVWHAEGLDISKVSVNMSALQLNDADIVYKVSHALMTYKVEPKHLIVEVTESALLDSGSEILDRISGIKALGVSIALDDFGTGYSSLSYLSNLPLNRLKIDRSFVNRIGTARDEVLINAIISIAHGMDLSVVAEGIETDEHLSFLLGKGCEYGQGYLFSKPLPVKEFEVFIQQNLVVEEPVEFTPKFM
ncbi:EAL domain-containing protein [Aliivibrio wodanis]|uniref:EAL domain-containing protein n=1 Tax=Aliivibrio wodanis TaxID=80852 RepID=UPI00406C689E